MNRHAWYVIVLMLFLVSGCASNPWGKESAELSQQDSPEAVRIKVKLLNAEELAGSAIDVESDNGRVVLRGFVETEEQKQRAEAIARESDNVTEVVNDIVVK